MYINNKLNTKGADEIIELEFSETNLSEVSTNNKIICK